MTEPVVYLCRECGKRLYDAAKVEQLQADKRSLERELARERAAKLDATARGQKVEPRDPMRRSA